MTAPERYAVGCNVCVCETEHVYPLDVAEQLAGLHDDSKHDGCVTAWVERAETDTSERRTG
jgi:hypothetical protein